MKTRRHAVFLNAVVPGQRGAALFLALIVLALMMLASIALIRTVDTSTVIAGNLAFRQANTSSADVAISNASNWIVGAASATLQSDSPTSGYYSTSSSLTLTSSATWVPGVKTALATGIGIAAGVDSSGNQIQYVIQRMCSSTGAATTANCLFGAATTQSSSQAVKDATQAGGTTSLSASPIYRVTVQVTGPRNTLSYVQGFLY